MQEPEMEVGGRVGRKMFYSSVVCDFFFLKSPYSFVNVGLPSV